MLISVPLHAEIAINIEEIHDLKACQYLAILNLL